MQLRLFDTSAPVDAVSDKKARDREASRLYALRHPDRIKAKYQRRREHYIEYAKKWRAANPDYGNEWRRADSAKNPAKWTAKKKAQERWRRDRDPDWWREKTWRVKAQQRARLYGAKLVEPFYRLEVFERDGWLCWICGEPVDRVLGEVHSRSASVDHVIPLSKGGDHSYANVRCAHFHCNSTRRDQVGVAL